MAKTNVYSSEKAIPAWMKVKDDIVLTLFSTRDKLFRYRQKPNHRDLTDFKNGIVTLYGLVCNDYTRNKKLQDDYPEFSELKEYLSGFNNNGHELTWWVDRYLDADGIIFDLGITKITQESDNEDDFGGVDDI